MSEGGPQTAQAATTLSPVLHPLRFWRDRLISEQLRSFALVGILLLVWVVFEFMTNGLFLSPRNLSILSLQVAITAILCAGIVMVIVPGHIDLSIGGAVVVCAIVTAMAMAKYHIAMPIAMLLTLVAGIALGVWHGFWIAFMGVPSFIVTLASFIALRGFALVITNGVSISPDVSITFLANYYLPQWATIAMVTLLWVGFVVLAWRSRVARLAAGIEVPIVSSVLIPAAVFGAVCLVGMVIALAYLGLPLPVAILLTIIAVVTLVLRNTRFGRHLYAIGGNAEAARLAGISIRWHTFWVFLAMGLLYGIAALIYISRLDAAQPTGATGEELLVIAAAVIGGTSLMGGRGTVIGAILGAVLMESLNNGMSLMNLPSSYQQVAVGVVLLLAVFVDVRSRKTVR